MRVSARFSGSFQGLARFPQPIPRLRASRTLSQRRQPLPFGKSLDMDLKKFQIHVPSPAQMNAKPVRNLLVGKPGSREGVRGRKIHQNRSLDILDRHVKPRSESRIVLQKSHAPNFQKCSPECLFI